MIPLLEDYKTRWHVESDHSIKPGLAAIEGALEKLGNPQQSLQVVHFAGTNGKGSTLTFVEQMARAHGLSVGKFMSPCIIDVHDQIQVNEQPISPNEMDALFAQFSKASLSGKLTDFELLTTAAFLYFKEQQVDLVLLETGMGGREDSTNVVDPIVSVIPSIALEHTKFLGDTLASIAGHKAGIIKNKKPVVIGEIPEEARFVIEQEAIMLQATLYQYGKHFHVQLMNGRETYKHVSQQVMIPNLQRQLLGKHQGRNMAVAITAFLEVANALHLSPTTEKIQAGIACGKLAGRFEEVLPDVYFDGAHNPASVQMLVDTVKEQFPQRRIEFVLGILADKDVKSILLLLEEVGDVFYFVDIHNERAMKAQAIYELSEAKEKFIVKDVISLLKNPNSENAIKIVTGSLYLLSEIRRDLQK